MLSGMMKRRFCVGYSQLLVSVCRLLFFYLYEVWLDRICIVKWLLGVRFLHIAVTTSTSGQVLLHGLLPKLSYQGFTSL
ncbi:hypothetical protein HOLleu_13104 [Holothuria leucospilota]|uniref:Uncharacterized protein n=1 Tax=Holothuria leucospilota TaxID=206669 RepID=A0A9Q1CBX6_HOLLE|nr:hypothetical protein HOLleu_13104 [Holothuria leucospilota]